MATIRTTLQMQDQMTGVIRNMSAALGASINAFEQLSSASNNAVSTSSVESARRSLGALNVDLANMESNMSEANSGQQRLNSSISDGEGFMKGLVGSALSLIGVYASLNGIKQAMDLSDQVTNTTARLNLMNDGLQTTEELQNLIFASSQRSLASYSDTANIVAQLGLRASDAFANNKETILFAENLAKSFAIAGANQQEMNSASLQLTQALGSGVLRGEELNAVFESAPNVIQRVADYLGVSIGAIREMASDGEIGAQAVKNAMLEATDDINKQFDSMPYTFQDVFTRMKNEALFAFDPVLTKLREISDSEKFMGAMNNIVTTLGTTASYMVQVLDVVTSAVNLMYDNWWILGPVIGVVTTFVVALGSALLAMQTYTLAAAAATWVLNSALWASPITWVFASVIALVGAFYLVIGAINTFAGTSISATGVVAGAFAALGAYLYNVFATLWNIFAATAEFLLNVFINPVYSIKMLFYNLTSAAVSMAESMIGSFNSAATNLGNMFISGANMAIKAINWVIDALNAVPGIDIGNVGEISARTSVSADLSGLRTKMANWVGDAPSNYRRIAPAALKSIPDAAVNTYKDINGKLNNAMSVDTGLEDLLNSIGDGVGDGAKEGKKTAKNTKKAADKAGIAADDLKYMRDLSEREAINRYTAASINVNVKNDLNVNNEVDIDGLIDRFGEKLEEAVETVAIGGDVI